MLCSCRGSNNVWGGSNSEGNSKTKNAALVNSDNSESEIQCRKSQVNFLRSWDFHIMSYQWSGSTRAQFGGEIYFSRRARSRHRLSRCSVGVLPAGTFDVMQAVSTEQKCSGAWAALPLIHCRIIWKKDIVFNTTYAYHISALGLSQSKQPPSRRGPASRGRRQMAGASATHQNRERARRWKLAEQWTQSCARCCNMNVRAILILKAVSALSETENQNEKGAETPQIWEGSGSGEQSWHRGMGGFQGEARHLPTSLKPRFGPFQTMESLNIMFMALH